MFLAELQEGCPGRKHVLTKQRILDYIPHLDSNILKLEGTEHYLPMCQECNNSLEHLGTCAAVKCTMCSQGLFVFVPKKVCPKEVAPTALVAPIPPTYTGLHFAGAARFEVAKQASLAHSCTSMPRTSTPSTDISTSTAAPTVSSTSGCGSSSSDQDANHEEPLPIFQLACLE